VIEEWNKKDEHNMKRNRKERDVRLPKEKRNKSGELRNGY